MNKSKTSASAVLKVKICHYIKPFQGEIVKIFANLVKRQMLIFTTFDK